MLIGVPKEGVNQPLVGATPDTVKKLISLGYDVRVQSGAGAYAHLTDQAYADAGAELTDDAGAWGADLVIALDAPTDEHLALMRSGATLITRLAPARNPELLEKLRAAGVTAMAMDTVPRISRAQAMDVLSSQANVAGAPRKTTRRRRDCHGHGHRAAHLPRSGDGRPLIPSQCCRLPRRR